MAGMNFEYDERGGTFYYFLVSFYALVLIPLTYYLWPRNSKKKDGSVDSKLCHCESCLIKDSLKKSREPWKKWKQRIINVFLLIAWMGFTALAYKAAHIENDHVEWDPYIVLGLDRGASVEEVKKAYRQLTKIHHPDKGGEEKRFVEITKAHLALTDAESKKNYDLYGNPDGPGGTNFDRKLVFLHFIFTLRLFAAQTFGIALPSWLVSKEYSFFVLAAYGLVFMIILPVAVGIWWYRSIKYSADSVLMKTTELFAHMEHKTSFLNVKRVITILSGAYEFWKMFNKEIIERPSDDIEVPMLIKQFPSINENKREGPFFIPYSVKARVLLYAHLSRKPLPADTLNTDLQYILKKCSYLVQELIQVHSQLYMYAMAGRVARTPALESLDNIMKVNPLLVQALWESKNSLLQLPHITEEVLRRSVLKKKRHVRTCAALAALSEDERRETLRVLNDSQYQDVLIVLSSMPHVEMDCAVEVKDDEDKTITAGALVTAVVRLKRTPLLDPSVVKNFYLKNSSTYQVQPIHTNFGSSFPQNDHSDVDDDELHVTDFLNIRMLGTLIEFQGHEDEEYEQDNVGEVSVQQPTERPQQKRNIWEKNKKKKGGKCKGKAKNPHQQKKFVTKLDSPAKKAENVQSGEKERKIIKETKDEENDYNADDDDFLIDEDFSRKEKILEAKSKITHLVHCPHFPEDKYEWWWVYICDRKKRQLVCPPVRVTTLVNEEEVELRFPAQRVPGVYSVQVCLRSDSYLDCDINKDIKDPNTAGSAVLDPDPTILYTVVEAKQVTSHPQWEFPEDDDKKSDDEISEEASEYTEEDEDLSDST
uniref:J domain-containing protein n=1 Tax=Romanomermis culicivorax TaxID=13658 RepID=A0A915IYQ5_ROMCU